MWSLWFLLSCLYSSGVWQGFHLWRSPKRHPRMRLDYVLKYKNTIRESTVNKFGRVQVFHLKEKKEYPLAPLVTVSSQLRLKPEMTMCVCNCWQDETFSDSIEQWKSSVELEVHIIGPHTLTQIFSTFYSTIEIRKLRQKQQFDVWPNLSALDMAICPPRLWLPANPDQM